MGVLREFLELAWTGGVEGIEGWVILHRAIRGAIGLSLGMVICLRLTRRWDSFLSGGMMGATVSQLGPISSALAWPALLSSGLIGLFAGSFCGLAGSVIPQFIPNVPAKAEVSSDPLDEEV
jgi:predicted membrane-bound spermidine synthase